MHVYREIHIHMHLSLSRTIRVHTKEACHLPAKGVDDRDKYRECTDAV